jgi:hypothetical protein
MADVETEVLKVPAGVMRMLEQSYGTRERQLDWLLAIIAVGATTFAFWPQLKGCIWPLPKDMKPNDEVTQIPKHPGARVMTYNLPPSRALAVRRGPTVVPIPNNPSFSPTFPVSLEDFQNPQA